MEGELLQEGEMTILIEHPEHGRTHVYTQDALKEHEAIGWRVVVVEKCCYGESRASEKTIADAS